MFKLLAAAVTAVGLSVVVASFATCYVADQNQPALAEASRAVARHNVTCDVIAGRLSLVQAATRFRDFNQQSPVITSVLKEFYQTASDEECACLQVIDFVRTELERRAFDAEQPYYEDMAADPVANVLTRLQAELAAARGKDGKVCLGGDAG